MACPTSIQLQTINKTEFYNSLHKERVNHHYNKFNTRLNVPLLDQFIKTMDKYLDRMLNMVSVQLYHVSWERGSEKNKIINEPKNWHQVHHQPLEGAYAISVGP